MRQPSVDTTSTQNSSLQPRSGPGPAVRAGTGSRAARYCPAPSRKARSVRAAPGLLSQRDHAVAEMLPLVGIEPAHLSQQLAVLRRANLVTARKQGSTVYYSLTSPQVAELLAVARQILTGVLAGQAELLHDLQASAAS